MLCYHDTTWSLIYCSLCHSDKTLPVMLRERNVINSSEGAQKGVFKSKVDKFSFSLASAAIIACVGTTKITFNGYKVRSRKMQQNMIQALKSFFPCHHTHELFNQPRDVQKPCNTDSSCCTYNLFIVTCIISVILQGGVVLDHITLRGVSNFLSSYLHP